MEVSPYEIETNITKTRCIGGTYTALMSVGTSWSPQVNQPILMSHV